MIVELHGDFESRSHVHPKDVGTYSYVNHPTTEPLFLWYRIDISEYRCWKIYLNEAIPADLLAALKNPAVFIVAFNSAFERYMLARLGYTIPPSRFIDPQVLGRYLSLPASLGVQCQVLGVPVKLAKKGGKDFIKLFCEPVIIKATKKNGLTEPKIYFNDWNSHPAEWADFLEYGKYDVISEGELLRRQRVLLQQDGLPPSEHRLWLFDQMVNDRGMPVDRPFVQMMYDLALRAKAEAKTGFEKMTGVVNANSPTQIKAWAKPQGYPFDTLKKDTVTSALKDSTLQISDLCRKALKMRAEAASTSYQKLGKIMEMVSRDGRLRGQFVFMGSARCGRWAGNAVQLHNMARPLPLTVCEGCHALVTEKGAKACSDCGSSALKMYDFEDQKVVVEARADIRTGDYAMMKYKYGSVLLLVKNLIRTVFSSDAV